MIDPDLAVASHPFMRDTARVLRRVFFSSKSMSITSSV